jgi:Fe-Mn family superoxide dismutase
MKLILKVLLILCLSIVIVESQDFIKRDKEAKMEYIAKDYSYLIGIEGFSQTLLQNHFTLYQGYVANTNKIIALLAQLEKENKLNTPEYAELKRRFGWEFNGMRLHELYFENIGKSKPLDSDSKLLQKIIEDFGSFENWEKDFKATGMMRGIGWVVLYYDATGNKLFNFWINEHDVAHPADCKPILIMDVFEHAYMIDYGLKKADYINAFFKNIKWEVLEKRFAH